MFVPKHSCMRPEAQVRQGKSFISVSVLSSSVEPPLVAVEDPVVVAVAVLVVADRCQAL